VVGVFDAVRVVGRMIKFSVDSFNTLNHLFMGQLLVYLLLSLVRFDDTGDINTLFICERLRK
jgi:hypothetical protein